MHRDVRATLTLVSELSLIVKEGRISEKGEQGCYEHQNFKQFGKEKLRLKITLMPRF
jgi:hypothetical protein